MGRRRGFGEIERRVSAAGRATYRARYAMPDGTRFSRTFGAKIDAEAWLAHEASLVDRETWTPPPARAAAQDAREQRDARSEVTSFAAHYLSERDLRPTTLRSYRQLLRTHILPSFGDRALQSVSLADIKQWRSGLATKTPASNAAAYRFLRSLLQAADARTLLEEYAVGNCSERVVNFILSTHGRHHDWAGVRR